MDNNDNNEREQQAPARQLISTKIGNQRTPFQREADRAYEARAYLTGVPIAEIAKHLSLSPDTIEKDLQAIQKVWATSQIRDWDAEKNRYLARIDALEQTYWESFRMSQKPTRVTRVEMRDGKFGPQRATQITKKPTTPGDAAYLLGVQWCLAERARTLGTHAPTKVAPTNIEGNVAYDPISNETRVAFLFAKFLDNSGNDAGDIPGEDRVISGHLTPR